jgi:hypothetical protein
VFIRKHAFSIDTRSADAAWLEQDTPRLLKAPGAQALVVDFSDSTRMGKPDHVIELFADAARTQLLGRYVGVGGGAGSAARLQPLLMRQDSAWLVVTRDAPRNVRIKASVCPVPTDLSLACWLLHRTIAKAEKGSVDWMVRLRVGLVALVDFLKVEALAMCLRTVVFDALSRGMQVLGGLQASPPDPLRGFAALVPDLNSELVSLHGSLKGGKFACSTYLQHSAALLSSYRRVFGSPGTLPLKQSCHAFATPFLHPSSTRLTHT